MFIKGGAVGSGCWMSTDYDSDDLWVLVDFGAESMNDISVSFSASGPWEDVGPAPWQPRASAALTTNPNGTLAILASGVSFVEGYAVEPVFGDVWAIDVSVCVSCMQTPV